MMRTTRMFWTNGVLAIGVLGLLGCNGMREWNWFGMKKTDNERTASGSANSGTRARRPSREPAVAAADKPKPAANPDDPKAKDVDDRVERYVKSMNNTYEPDYESNDFRAKMRRQSDPNRSARIRQTAAKGREQTPGDDSSGSGPPRTAQGTQPGSQTARLDDSAPLETETLPALSDSPATENERPRAGTGSADSLAADSKAASNKPTPKTAGKAQRMAEPPESSDDTPRLKSRDGMLVEPESKPAPLRPPVLGEVKVAAAPSPEKDSTKESEEAKRPAANVVPQTVTVDTFKKRMEEQEALAAKDPNNVEEQFKLRLMYLVNGQEARVLAATPGMNAEIQDIMQAQLRTLIAARSSAQRDPALWANKQIEAIEELRRLVRSRADLSVPRVVLCKSIVTFGQYTPFEPLEFKAGKPNKVLLYVEVENFSMEKTSSGQFRVLLTMRQSLLNKAGEELWSAKEENIEDLSRQPRRDFYLAAERTIPKTLNPGDYVLKVEIEDVLAGKINSNAATFKLVP